MVGRSKLVLIIHRGPRDYHGAVIAARWFLRALLALALLIPLLTLSPAVARADGPGLIDVTITSNSAPVIDLSDPEQVVELTGTIINTSTSRVQFTAVDFWTATGPISSMVDLEATLESRSDDPFGERTEPSTLESGHIQRIQEGDWFSPGERAPFRVRATVAELGFSTDDAAYLVGVHVRGIVEGLKGRQTVGRGRILVAATSSPVSSTQVVQLAAGPQRAPTGDFLDNSLSTALTSDLDQLLAIAENTEATVLVDPMLLLDARALGSQHTVDGETAAPVEAAARWANRLERLMTSGRVFRLPWGNLDVPRAQAAGLLPEAMEWTDGALTDADLRKLPLAANLGAAASDELADELSKLGFSVVFASNTAGGMVNAMRVVRVSEPNRKGMGPGGSNTSAQQLGRRVASELLSRVPLTYLVNNVEDARSMTTLRTSRMAVPVGDDDEPASFSAAGEVPVWGNLASRITDLLSDASFRRDLTGNDDLPQLERMAALALSSGFTTEQAAAEWLASGPVVVVDPSKVVISAAGEFVMGSRTNTFPVTITNGLDVPVTLRIVFDSDSPQRIRVPATDFVTIEAGESRVITMTPEASSNSAVSVEGRLETEGGRRFGAPVRIDITATELGRVAWIIIVVSGAVVLGGTVWRIRAVQSERSGGNT